MTALYLDPEMLIITSRPARVSVLGLVCRHVDGGSYCGIVAQLLIHAHVDAQCVTVSRHHHGDTPECLAIGRGRHVSEADANREAALRARTEAYEEASQILNGGEQ